MALMLKFPFAKFENMGSFDSWGHHMSEGVTVESLLTFPAYYLVLGLISLTLIAIFMFKKRNMQVLLGRLNYLLILGLIVVLYLNIDKLNESLSTTIEYGVGLYLPVAALAFNFLANRAIKKDEDLVKSLDRLR
ncbi:MAG: peptidoglycan/LPS O-acetylase OafA/YrhL [Patiriisocius sp.]|jgi:peptidoglycan/LPS O-acetylase OafA/YrhL